MSEQFKSIETTELVKIANAIRTKTGTTDKISLEDMPAKIAAIESGESAGGGSVGTCTVNVVCNSGSVAGAGATVVNANGELECLFSMNNISIIENCACGSVIVLDYNYWGDPMITTSSNMTLLGYPWAAFYFRAPVEDGAVGTITLDADD